MNPSVVDEQIQLCAKQLKIPTFAEYDRFLRQADFGVGFAELLLELMKAKCSVRQDNQMVRRLKAAATRGNAEPLRNSLMPKLASPARTPRVTDDFHSTAVAYFDGGVLHEFSHGDILRYLYSCDGIFNFPQYAFLGSADRSSFHRIEQPSILHGSHESTTSHSSGKTQTITRFAPTRIKYAMRGAGGGVILYSAS